MKDYASMSELQLQFKNLLRKYGMLEDFERSMYENKIINFSAYASDVYPELWLENAFRWDEHPNGGQFWERINKEWLDLLERIAEPVPVPEQSKYHRTIKGVSVDVYDVLKAFEVTCPAMQHAIKKMLASGQRGYKDSIQDKREAIASIERSIELEDE